MAKVQKTMRGKKVNMDTLRIKHEKSIAIGNMNVNAGGDQLGPGGVIIKDRNERIREENKLHTMVPSKASGIKNKQTAIKKSAAQAAADLEIEEAKKLLAEDEVSEEFVEQVREVIAKTPKKKKTTKKKAAE